MFGIVSESSMSRTQPRTVVNNLPEVIPYSSDCIVKELLKKNISFLLAQLNQILHNLEQKLDPITSNVAMALLPIAVRWASTFLPKSDVQYVQQKLSKQKASI